MDLLTIIYSPNVDNLLKFQPKATHWLPTSTNTSNPDIYQLGNTICTTKESILEMVQILIKASILLNDKVIYIHANDNEIIGYTFDSNGNFNNFFKLN